MIAKRQHLGGVAVLPCLKPGSDTSATDRDVPLIAPARPAGQAYAAPTHIWRLRATLPERKGQPCRLLARGRMNSCLIEFQDGTRHVVSRWAVRKLPA